MDRPLYRKAALFLAACIVLFILPAVYLLSGKSVDSSEDPARAAKRYLTALYARDYSKVYQWTSAEDQKHKTKMQYLAESPPFYGPALELAYLLADKVEWHELRSQIQGAKAEVHYRVTLPDANAPPLQEIFLDFDPTRLSRLWRQDRREIERKLDSMKREGTLPTIDGEGSLELVREDGRWKAVNNWGGAIRVRFSAEVKEGLAWNFQPAQEIVLAKPGETLRAFYKAKNVSGRPLTAKARHLDEPKELSEKYLEIIQCFCFIQQTLAPGEEKEFPLLFRVHANAPDDVREFHVHYQFYPIDKFPQK